MYYRAAGNRKYINSQLNKWFKDGEISPEMGKGLKMSAYKDSGENGEDLIRGFDNYTQFSEEAENQAESPVSDGRGGYVPNGGTELPPKGEKSRLEGISYDGVYGREIKLMHELYGRINSFLQPIVVEIIDEEEYPGGSVYDYNLPVREGKEGGTIRDFEISRDSLNRMTDRAYQKAVMKSDEINEIMNDNNEITAGATREELLRAAIESLILTELFLSRRPFYRSTAEAYRFIDGRYDGINPVF